MGEINIKPGQGVEYGRGGGGRVVKGACPGERGNGYDSTGDVI